MASAERNAEPSTETEFQGTLAGNELEEGVGTREHCQLPSCCPSRCPSRCCLSNLLLQLLAPPPLRPRCRLAAGTAVLAAPGHSLAARRSRTAGGASRGTRGGPALDTSGTKAVAGGVFDNQGIGLASRRKDNPEAGAGAGYSGGALGAAGVRTYEEGDKSGRGRPACWPAAARACPLSLAAAAALVPTPQLPPSPSPPAVDLTGGDYDSAKAEGGKPATGTGSLI
jgi:hypothetical protein